MHDTGPISREALPLRVYSMHLNVIAPGPLAPLVCTTFITRALRATRRLGRLIKRGPKYVVAALVRLPF